MKDHYATLGIDASASLDDIKKAYRKLARKYHPDVSTEKDAEVKMRDLNEAYGVLSDDGKKTVYDYDRRHSTKTKASPSWTNKPGPGSNPFENAEDISKAFEEMMRRARAGQGGSGDYYDSPFGGGRKRRYTWDDMEKESDYDYGHGDRDDPWYREDFHKASHEEYLDVNVNHTITPQQAFKGMTVDVGFKDNGTAKNVQINIPAGIRNGQKVRGEKAGRKTHDGDWGDLYVNVTVDDTGKMRVVDDDIVCDVPINVLSLVIGGTVDIETVDGVHLQVSIRAGTQLGQRIRIPGRGMVIRGSVKRGDMFLELKPFVPKFDVTSKEFAVAQKAIDKLI